MTDTNSKIEMNNERQRRQNIIVYNLTEDDGKSKEKELKAPERSNKLKNRKRNPPGFR